MKMFVFLLVIFYTFLGCKDLFGQKGEVAYSCAMFKKSLQAMQDVRDMYEEDKVLQEIYDIGSHIYKNMVELVALYYCKNMIVDAQILYDKILIDTCKDALTMIKLLALYTPLLCKNTKIAWKKKVQKLTVVGCVMILSVTWLRMTYYNQKLKSALYNNDDSNFKIRADGF